MKTIYFAASSLDGFIADTNDSLDWLVTRDVDPAGPLGYDGFIANVGAVAMGSVTFEWLRAQEPESWPYSVPSWVFTHRRFNAPAVDVHFTHDDVAQVHAEMVCAAKGSDVWLVGGGELVGQFADAQLLDEVWIHYAPVTLGRGAPVLPRRLELELAELVRNGEFACTRYLVHYQ